MNGHTDAAEIISPNNVLANAMLRSVDMVRPRLQATNPDRVTFCVGTQINGAPHLGTSLVHTAAFLLAKATKRTFNVDTIVVWLVGKMLADPKHFYRSYTTHELDRIMTARPPAEVGVRAREMNLYRRYFDLVAAGRKTIEIRVQYPNLRKLKAGDHIRFICGRDDVLTQVKRVARYSSFEEMFDAEGPSNVNPDSPLNQQLANIRRIYGPEKEALGVLAIEIALVTPVEPDI